MEDGKNVFKILIGKSRGKRPLKKPRCRWKDKVRMNLKGRSVNTRN
jgi:hypothetical protein